MYRNFCEYTYKFLIAGVYEIVYTTIKVIILQYKFSLFPQRYYLIIRTLIIDVLAKRDPHSVLRHSDTTMDLADLLKPWAIFAPRQHSGG